VQLTSDRLETPLVGTCGTSPQIGAATNASDDTRCRLCDVRLRTRFPRVRDAVTGECFAILECPVCGLGVTVPSVVDLPRYYGPAYWGGRHAFTADYCARRRIRLLSSLARPKAGSRLLDFGCGDGDFLRRASRKGWISFGYESTFSPVRSGTEYEVVTTHEALAARAPFDAITAWHVLEHLPEPFEKLRELAGMLTPDGIIILAVPDAGGVQASTFGAHWMHLDVPRHLFHLSRSSLEMALKLAGLAPVRWWNREFEYDVMGWSQSALALAGNPSAFFNAVTGRMRFGPRWVMSFMCGATLSLATLPLAAKWGSSLTVAASRLNGSARP
jgi:2-polyprenyl-3-methyl-5-hydroxy-6-metoxy-1,4-benzoquinol methylase